MQVARRGGAFFNQAADAVESVGKMEGRMAESTIRDAGKVADDYITHKDTSQYNVASSALVAEKTKQWNQALNGVKNPDGSWAQKPLNPDDPTALKQFSDGLNSDLDTLKDSMLSDRGQQHAENHNASIRNHFQTITAADISTAANAAAKEKAVTVVNNYTNAAVNDPAGVEGYANLAKNAIEAEFSNHEGLRGANGIKARTDYTIDAMKQIYFGAASAAIQKSKNPEATAKYFTQKYPDYINGTEALRLGKDALHQSKINFLTDKQIESHNNTQEVRAAHSDMSKNFTDNVSFDENGKATIKPDYFKNLVKIEDAHPGAATERTTAMLNWGQAQQREKREVVITDKAVQSSLYDGLFNPDKPTTDVDILKAAAESKLDPHATSTLLALQKSLEEAPLKGPIYRDTMTAVKGSLGDSEKGHENYAKFAQTFIPQYLKQQRAGTLPPNALDLRDENSLISKSLAPWRLTPQEKMMGRIMKNLGGGDPGDIAAVLGGKNITGAGTTVTGVEVKDAPIALPPTAERKAGQTYPTPRGSMKWTGTGWVSP